MIIWERIKLWFLMTFTSLNKEDEIQDVYSDMQRIRKENNLP